MKSKILLFLVFIMLYSLLVGCSQGSSTIPTSLPTPTKSPFPTKTPVRATTTHVPTMKITSTFTMTPVETLTPILTATKAPTYSKNKFLELYHTNGHCQLPCWWSITPGKTTVDEVRLQFASFGEVVVFEESENQIMMFYPGPNDSIDYNIFSMIYFDEENGVVTSISLPAEAMMYNGFNPTELLARLGKPDQVRISSSKIIMLYEELNIFAVYDVSLNADTHQICFQNYNSLELWSSQVDSTSSPVKDQVNAENLHAFYDAFKIWRGSENCFLFQ